MSMYADTYDLVPVCFSDGTLVQMLLRPSNIMRVWQIGHHLGSGPATIKNLGLGIRKAPFEIGNGTSIGALTRKIVWVLEIDLSVSTT